MIKAEGGGKTAQEENGNERKKSQHNRAEA